MCPSISVCLSLPALSLSKAPNTASLVAHVSITPNKTKPADVQRTTKLLPIENNFLTQTTTLIQAILMGTTTDRNQPLPSVAVLAPEEGGEGDSSSGKDSGLLLKVGVPVLAIVVFILGISGCIVAATSCVLFNSEKK